MKDESGRIDDYDTERLFLFSMARELGYANPYAMVEHLPNSVWVEWHAYSAIEDERRKQEQEDD